MRGRRREQSRRRGEKARLRHGYRFHIPINVSALMRINFMKRGETPRPFRVVVQQQIRRMLKDDL